MLRRPPRRSPHVLPDYDGTLIKLALDLATRMLPAFDTPSGLPSLWVNLAKGQNPADTNVTCTACAGTLLLEFGVLSALTGGGCGQQQGAALQLYLAAQPRACAARAFAVAAA
jgi:hypothetical protein